MTDGSTAVVPAKRAVASVWAAQGLPMPALDRLDLGGFEPVLPSSFAVGTAAQASMALAALAASEWGRLHGGAASRVGLDMRHAALECCMHFAINGVVPELWDAFSGLYRCADGFVRIHANFAHHRAIALGALGLSVDAASKADVQAALASWPAQRYEDAVTLAGGVVAAFRSREQWLAHPQHAVVAASPLIEALSITPESAASSPMDTWTNGRFQPKFDVSKPLKGLRVLELTRILAGPICGRTLAAYGADVLLVNSPNLPNIDAIADTSRGKRSAHLDLRTSHGRATLTDLIAQADVFVQGYRPGGLAALGFGAGDLARINPRIVAVSLSAYGFDGPWRGKRGFDSLVQTATGFNADEQLEAGAELPRPMPMQILDCATGHLMAFAAVAACMARDSDATPVARHMQLSLARTAEWVRSLGRVAGGFDAPKAAFDGLLTTFPSGFGELTAMRHAVSFDGVEAGWELPSMPPGSHEAVWA